MRTAWIEAEDYLSDAPTVANCFAKEVAGTLPLTIASDETLSHVIFRFRAADEQINLAVVLHDDRELWSSTSVAIGWGGAESASIAGCAAARELTEQLRTAMEAARDGIWYQAPDHVAAVDAFDVLDVDYQLIEANHMYWRFSWKMSVRNNGRSPILVDPAVEFLNRGGFIVDTDDASKQLIPPQQTSEIAGSTLVGTKVAPSVASVVGRATRVR